ncbi:hypothetical protein MMO39_01890 [Acinetobacter modestus]|uniref:hypothetical protein n=1 Tax=Acinetobacter modestus TaxID=1776740 RepID=UPI001F4B50A8|nr:hypothetical protein [Acinetobacter modestus]MCH7333114.1 hypothetical protein [Acinetobacter modestus]MCH7386058.1 hypothetical protein [Acinetobacter modestus]
MENKQHYYTYIGVIMFITAFPIVGWAVQPMTEGSLALQTGALNRSLPNIIEKAQRDAMQPEEERWRTQRVLSDRNLREIRISMLAEGALSPYEEQKKTSVSDVREKRKANMKPHTEAPDRFMIYEFDSSNVKKTKITYR